MSEGDLYREIVEKGLRTKTEFGLGLLPAFTTFDLKEILAKAKQSAPHPNARKYHVQAKNGYGAYYDYKTFMEDYIHWFQTKFGQFGEAEK